MTQYEITCEEVREIMAALSDIKNTLGRLEEREVARDDRVSRRVEAEAAVSPTSLKMNYTAFDELRTRFPKIGDRAENRN